MAYRLNASTIKSWFQYRCERKVRYEISTPDELDAVPVRRDLREQAWARLGVEYEDRVVTRLASEQPILRPANGARDLSERMALAFLRGARPELYAAQLNLRPQKPPLGLGDIGVELTRTFPDLVRREVIDGEAVFTIIDIKATRGARLFHKAQVAYYVRILEAVLLELNIPAKLSPRGEIWRIADDGDAAGDSYQVEQFALAPYLRLVDEFCTETLREIISKVIGRGVDQTFFHVYFKCEQCDFLPHCTRAVAPEQPAQRRDVSAVAGLSHEGKKSLHRLGVKSVADLAAAHGLSRSQNLSWSLARKAETLVARANALATDTLARTAEEHTYLMPPRADVAFLLSVDHDAVDDRLAAIGYRRLENGVIAADLVRVIDSGDGRAEIEAIVSVLGELIADLGRIDAANAARDDGDGAYAHIFFYEPSEVVNLQQALGRHLDDPRIRDGLLHLIRLFPPDEIVPEPEFRGIHHLPATPVRSVIEQLYAVPATVSYDLRQVSSQIARAVGVAAPYTPDETFARPFSSLLSIDVIRALKDGRGELGVDAVAADVRARLGALQALVEFLFAQNQTATREGRQLLRLAKRPFQFQATFDPLNAIDLDVLTACELLENRSGLLESLVRLAQPARRRVETAQCLGQLSLVRMWKRGPRAMMAFSVPPESRAADLGPGDFDLILSDDEADLRLDPRRWPLISCKIEPPQPGYEDAVGSVLVSMRQRDADGPVMRDLLQRTREQGWFVDRSFLDLNTGRAVSFLRDLARDAA